MKKFIYSILVFVVLSACNKSVISNNSSNKNSIVLIETDFGAMKFKLFDETPKHKANFIKLVKEGFYDELLFHRVINKFMIQGGDPDSKNAAKGIMLGNGGPGYTIAAEFNDSLLHYKGALAAARMGDNVNPDKASSGSQFYIVQGQVIKKELLKQFEQRSGNVYNDQQKEIYANLGGTPHLDGAYTVFGLLFEGMDVLDKIAAVQCDSRNRPLEDVKMKISLVRR